ncbi:unnamed protein product [Periconia digitata]|uniref:Uncharacterized protein n=1 Tax=Periconia digitata TaxID=1303443 RepID=A0A9W4UCL3_9PLEO|nr:unnamed protein product [Periconia digitata]
MSQPSGARGLASVCTRACVMRLWIDERKLESVAIVVGVSWCCLSSSRLSSGWRRPPTDKIRYKNSFSIEV